MDPFLAYGHAIVSLAGVVLIGLLLGPLSAVKKQSQGVTSGGQPEADYTNPAYRWSRAHLNFTEMMGLYVGSVAAAILAGAAPFWVNLLASLFFLSRVAVAWVHIRGLGRPDTGLRTLVFTLGWASCLLLSLMAIVAVFQR